jgi:patatin-like phospholipase/acyl hydrolase
MKFGLSIDGGGSRIVASLHFLKKIEERYNKPIFELFDYFAGTSSGGMVSLLIITGNSATECVNNIYTRKNMKKIMTKWSWWYHTPFRPKYSSSGKRGIIDKYAPDIKIKDLKKPVFISTYCLDTRQPIIHTNHPTVINSIKQPLDETAENSIRDVADATSAAPTYFPSVFIEAEKKWHIDGGLAATNNPSVVLFSRMNEELSIDDIKILSVGTGELCKPLDGKKSKKWGALGWISHNIIDIMLNSPGKMSSIMTKTLLDDNYIRIQSSLGDIDEKLDNLEEDNLNKLKNLGEKWFMDNIEKLDLFFNHHVF